MSNRLISALIFLQLFTLLYLVWDRQVSVQAEGSSDIELVKLGNQVRELKEEIAQLKQVTAENNYTKKIPAADIKDKSESVESGSQDNKLSKSVTPDLHRSGNHDEVYIRSSTIVSDAIARTQWVQPDSVELMRLAPSLTREQKDQLLEQIADAVNRQQLKLMAPLPPM